MCAALAVSQDCSLLASLSAQDRTLKVFDVATFDMIAMLRLPFQPSCAEWVYQVRLLLSAELCLERPTSTGCAYFAFCLASRRLCCLLPEQPVQILL